MSNLIVFDVDGTILDSFGMFERALLQYSNDSGLPAPCFDTIRMGYGDPDKHDFKWGVSKEEQLRHLKNSYRMADLWAVSGEPDKTAMLFEGVEDVLVELKDHGHTLAIVTSKAEAPLIHMLEYHNLYTLFSAHRNGGDIKRRNEKEKPEPDMLNSIMRELNFVPDETVMIGDTTMDIHMGIRATTQTIGVTWGCHPKDVLAEAGAHQIVETHFRDMSPAIKKIFSST